jgi:hypothetical protein
MPFAFEKLIVYQKAIDFADRICGKLSSLRWPRSRRDVSGRNPD